MSSHLPLVWTLPRRLPFQMYVGLGLESMNTSSGTCYCQRKHLEPFLSFEQFITVATDTELMLMLGERSVHR